MPLIKDLPDPIKLPQRKRWQTHDEVEVQVRCGHNLHRVRWRKGRLTLLDHSPGDYDGERMLIWLASNPNLPPAMRPCRCHRILTAWRHVREDRWLGHAQNEFPDPLWQVFRDVVLERARTKDMLNKKYDQPDRYTWNHESGMPRWRFLRLQPSYTFGRDYRSRSPR